MASTKKMESKPKIKYSNMEQKLLDVLAKGVSVTTEDLVANVYEKDHAPLAASHSVTSVMKSLIRKTEINKEPFTIIKTSQGGPYQTLYQKVTKQR